MTSERQTFNFSILVVDDDEQIRRLCRITLEAKGYKIFEADSPSAALEIWDADPHAIDLVLTDFHMPGLTGLELVKSMRDKRPELPVLLISGCYIGVPPLPPGITFLEKPFSLQALAKAVRDCLQPAS